MGEFLDIPTLFFILAAASCCICVSLILTWTTSRGEKCALSWGAAFALAVLTMILVALRGQVPRVLSVTVANAVLLTSFGALWLGYRQFIGRAGRSAVWMAGAGALIWLVLSAASSLFDDVNIRAGVLSGIELVYLLFIVAGLVRHYTEEPLPSVGLTAVLVGTHAAVQVYWIASAIIAPIEPATVVLPNSLAMGLRFTESSIFVVFLGLLQLVMIGQRSERRYRIVSETDSLTGLANRGHFFRHVGAAMSQGGKLGALILFDIDHFKSINDTHGHPTGDRALVAFASGLAAAVPAGGVAARVGGEEFALFLPKASTDQAAEVADDIRRMTAGLRIAATDTVRLTVSCGVAGIGETGSDVQNLHAAADRALYLAKGNGRDQVAVHRPSVAKGQMRLDCAVTAAAH